MPNFQIGTPSTGMAVADFNSDGKLDVAGCGAVLLGDEKGDFQGWQLNNLPPGPFKEVIGDFDRNGTTDVAVLSGNQSYSVFILSNDGTGSLTLTHTYALQQQGYGIAAADFNGDGNLDLAVIGLDATFNTWSYSILLGNGDGSFQSPVSYSQSVTGSSSLSIVVADFNSDHKPDLAVSSMGSSFAVLLGNGDGTFSAPVYYYNAGFSPLLVADFNGDGKLDIAAGGTDISVSPPAQKTAILFGNGDGTFQAAIFPPSLTNFQAAFSGDLNNDGKTDLISTSQVALGNGDSTFGLLPPFSCQPFSCQVNAVADINGDGKPDLFVTEALDYPIHTGVVLGNGDGTFSSFTPVPANGLISSPVPVLIADMNGDARPDLIFNWGYYVWGIGVILNTTPAGPEVSATALSPSPVIAGNAATSTVTVVPMFGFNSAVTLTCAGLTTGVTCAFNPSFVANSSGTSTLTISTTANVGAGTYTVQVQGTSGSVSNSVPLSLVVQAAPDFTIGPASGTPNPQTVNAGQTASFSLSLAGIGSFSGTVNLSCAITPMVTPAPTCDLSSSSVQVSGSSPQTATVNVMTTAPLTTSVAPSVVWPAGPMWAIFAVSALSCLLVRGRRRLSAFATPILLSVVALSLSCGGSSSHHTTPGTPPGPYTATVTATSGGLSHNTALDVIVQ